MSGTYFIVQFSIKKKQLKKKKKSLRKNRSILLKWGKPYHRSWRISLFLALFSGYNICTIVSFYLCEVYSRSSTNGHLFTTATFFCPGGQSIHSLCTDVPPPSEKKSGEETLFPIFSEGGGTSVQRLSIHCIHTTATSPQRQQPVFSATDEKVKNIHEIWTVWRVDDSHSDRILIVLHLFTQLQ